MSAWIVTKKHIDVLVTWALNNNLVIDHKGQLYKVSDNPDRVGLELWAENHRSVNYRYGENTPVPEYKFKESKRAPIVVCKSIHCYDYQACEHESYEESFAYAFVIKALDVLLQQGYNGKHPEYEGAPWGL